jgi:molybdopterin-guanine dinucleotide biosynthesis protein A
MGKSKAHLEYNSKPLYLQAYELLTTVCSSVYLSARSDQAFELPTISDDAFQQIGPASGLLSAHETFRDTWFVLACDFPLATAEAVQRLYEVYKPPATFYTMEGQIEPLFAIWSPEALDILKENVSRGKTGPIFTLKSLGNGIEPKDKRWLYNTNTPEEWQLAQSMSRTGQES